MCPFLSINDGSQAVSSLLASLSSILVQVLSFKGERLFESQQKKGREDYFHAVAKLALEKSDQGFKELLFRDFKKQRAFERLWKR